jgi:hypothetical protein
MSAPRAHATAAAAIPKIGLIFNVAVGVRREWGTLGGDYAAARG